MNQNINNWTIYMYTFPNGKRYIGATTRPLYQRQGKDWCGYKRCQLLYAAVQEFGIDCIEQTIVFQGLMENEVAAEVEAFLIEAYKTNAKRYNNPAYGYNQSDGGEGTTKKNLSEARIRDLQDQMDEFHRAKIGTHASEETRRRQSESHMGQTRGVMSIEQRRKISQTNTKKRPDTGTRIKRATGNPKAVILRNTKTGKNRYFESRTAAGEYLGVKSSNITRWINGSRRPPEGLVVIAAENLEESEVAAS